jgi:hypothetical protein
MFVRRTKAKGRWYYSVVESYRDRTGKPTHRQLASLGQAPTIEAALAELRDGPLAAAERAGDEARLAQLRRKADHLASLAAKIGRKQVVTTPPAPRPRVSAERLAAAEAKWAADDAAVRARQEARARGEQVPPPWPEAEPEPEKPKRPRAQRRERERAEREAEEAARKAERYAKAAQARRETIAL